MLTAALALLLQAAAAPQEEEEIPPPRKPAQESRYAGAWRSRMFDLSDEIGIDIRFTMLGGDAVEDESWGDFFGGGIGVAARYEHLWRVAPTAGIGFYGAISLDSFSGDSTVVESVPGGFVNVELEDMTLFRALVGFTARQHFKNFFLAENIGIGLAFYPDIEAEVSGTGTINVGAIDASNAIAFEIGLRGGVMVSRTIDIGLGVAYEINGAPDDGELDAGVDGQRNFVLSLALNVNF